MAKMRIQGIQGIHIHQPLFYGGSLFHFAQPPLLGVDLTRGAVEVTAKAQPLHSAALGSAPGGGGSPYTSTPAWSLAPGKADMYQNPSPRKWQVKGKQPSQVLTLTTLTKNTVVTASWLWQFDLVRAM